MAIELCKGYDILVVMALYVCNTYPMDGTSHHVMFNCKIPSLYLTGNRELSKSSHKLPMHSFACFSCWQNGWLVAVFRIDCERRSSVEALPDLLLFIATLLTIICIFVIGVRMWRASKDKRYK